MPPRGRWRKRSWPGVPEQGSDMIEILQLDTPSLGDRSYLATDGTVALVVDPQRDIDRVLALAGERGLRITHVFETHLHNDYLTGGLALARETGAAYHVSAADQVAFDRVPVTRRRRAGGHAVGPGPGAGHPRAHVHAPGLRAGRGRRGSGGGVHRRVTAVRLDRADRPAGRGACGGAGPGPARVGGPAGRPPAGPGSGAAHARVRQLLRGQLRRPAVARPPSARRRPAIRR